ncbi:NUDIX domain-containing protein [Bacillus sp. BSL6]|uniref:NUDIX domain-containing protein n=1 Tax=Bacillus TaxID=1386 RepID=UPI0029014D03|nr:NUDIX domain-containing protein [Bacillus sp. (in: firmicutes)]MBL3820210.1 NUDIX domain-containing protein [Bacillus cereus]MDU2392217.1 NUDIX domain-containing protein [Bacillus sp. (in: firmicutes)]
MTRNRGAAIIVQEGKIALIKRIREDETYYVFPGGGIEEGETPEEFEMKDRGIYIPLWLPIYELEKVNIKPYEVVESILEHYKI